MMKKIQKKEKENHLKKHENVLLLFKETNNNDDAPSTNLHNVCLFVQLSCV